MTREKIIEILERKSSIPNDDETWDEIDNAYNETIKILKQEPILDKIRAEIEYHRRKTQSIDPYDLVGDCLDIIDKYKAESEE